MSKFISRHKKKLTLVLHALITASCLLLISYAITNFSSSVGSQVDLIRKSQFIINKFYSENSPVPDSLLFVNVSYDKQLADIYDTDGFKLGNTDITNRQSLLELLDILSKRNDYKYIVLDVFFEDGIETEFDSMLFTRIASMERIVIPNIRGLELAHKNILKEKAFLSDYTTTFFNSYYHKFVIGSGEQNSIPYQMYYDITGNRHTSWGIFHFDDGELCTRSLFTYPHIIQNELYDSDGNRNYYNLSADLLADKESLLTDELLANKYIFIGDMVQSDAHETVVGKTFGPVIIANAFISFMNRQHVFPMTVMFTLLIIYFIFAMQIYSRKSLFTYIVNKKNNKGSKTVPVIGFALSWLTYSFILTIICLVFYYTYGVAYDILVTSTILQILDYIIAHRTQIAEFSGSAYKKIRSKIKKR